MLLKILMLACVGAVIGWTTNVIAIKLLFRPLKPINILGIKIQGLIPKRRLEIAKSIGDTVEQELLSVEDIIDQVLEGTDKADVIGTVKARIISMAEEKLPSFIPSTFAGMITKYIEEMIDENGESILDEITENLIHKATNSISISKLVENKISMFELEKIEEIIVKIAKSELKHIEYLGGVIGFLIGISQGLILILM